MKKFYVTTPIYYASGKPHIGHAYTTVLADILKRYKQLFGYKTFFTTGMDEHGQKISDLAKNNDLDEQTFVNEKAEFFLDLWKKLDIHYDAFLRTSSKEHIKTVQSIFSQMLNNKDIYLSEWIGYYCVGCEENYVKKDVIFKDNKMFCQIGHEITFKKEETYFFKMSDKSDWLKNYYQNHPNFILPVWRVVELENNFLNDLMDLSISRTTFNWGIPVLENKKHVLYVWLDALFSYLTALGFQSINDQNYQDFWADKNTERVHLMSREIIRFHCIYWPIFLNSLNLNLPTTILSHGWIITKEGKMSKSLGNVVDPFLLIEKYGSDSLRYFIAKELGIHKDGIFNEEFYVEIINTDLSNNIGNLVSRTIGMLKKYTNYAIPKFQSNVNKLDGEFETLIKQTIKFVRSNVEEFKIDKAVETIVELVKFANKYIEITKPWNLLKENKQVNIESLLSHLSLTVFVVAYLLQPVLTKSVHEITKQMNFNFSKIQEYNDLLNTDLVDDIKVNDSVPIYTRFETLK